MKLTALRVGSAVAALLFLAPIPKSRAQPEGEMGGVEATLLRIQEALGGEAALAALTSLRVTASCQGPGGAFETEVASFRTKWTWFRQQGSDGSITEVWSGPERTWTIESNGELRDLSEGVRFFVRSHEFHFLLFELPTRFSHHRIGADATIREQPCTTVHMKDGRGGDAAVFIDRATGLPVMLEMNPEGAAGPVRIYFERWEQKAGVQFFQAFELTEGPERNFRYDYQSIEPNVVSALQFVEPVAPGQHEDLRALLVVLEDERRAHLDTDVSRLVSNVADELLDVSSGAIQRMSRADVAEVFVRVFEGATYEQWDDTEPPRIKIAADGTLAWVSRRVAVRRSVEAPGEVQHSRFVSAYASTYEKQDGRWKMTSVTSTFLPESAN